MKFYEFNEGFGYYALIAAKTEDEATKLYAEVVADIDDKDAVPDEATAGDVLMKVIASYTDYADVNDFAKKSLGTEPFIACMDGSLT